MTWIFAEDFEGITKSRPEGINLNFVGKIEVSSYSLFIGEHCWDFANATQAQAAYEKIKGMLRPPLTMQQVYAYEPVSKKIPFPAGQ